MSNPDSFPIDAANRDRGNQGKSVVGLDRSKTEKPPLNHFVPDPWLRSSRSTPGMTNRINEERSPANPGPGQYKSYNHEMPDSNVVNNSPGVFNRDDYITGGTICLAALVLIFFSLR